MDTAFSIGVYVKVYAALLALVAVSGPATFCQQASPSATPATKTGPAASPVALPDADKPRIYVTDSDSWQLHGSSGGVGGTFGASVSGGASPQTAEIIKTFGQRCPNVVANNRLEMADYVVTLQHEGGKGLLRKKDKVAVFVRKTGDSVFSESTLSVGGSVQGSCGAILAHWTAHAKEIAAMASPTPSGQAPTQVVVTSAAAPVTTKLNINSTPPGADIEINGNFVGNTPSIVEVDSGKNDVKVTKKGYSPWSRTLTIKGGTITLNAELEQN
jgi:hypothetical protein